MQISSLPATLHIATRRSKLAMIQANMVKETLEHGLAQHGHECKVSLLPLQTTGDRRKEENLADIGGKGVFTKEIEEALLEGRAEIAMHSLKDVPAIMPKGLMLAGCLPRADYRDALIARTPLSSLSELQQGARVGTSSPRRAAQLLKLRPDLQIIPFRGNVPTRLAKLEAGEIDATLLAVAGLQRLGMTDSISLILGAEQMLPAIGQGIIALQCREDHTAIKTLLAHIRDPQSWIQLQAERAVLEVIEGDCRSPIAGLAQLQGGRLRIEGLVIREDGQTECHKLTEGRPEAAFELGQQTGKALKAELGRVWG